MVGSQVEEDRLLQSQARLKALKAQTILTLYAFVSINGRNIYVNEEFIMAFPRNDATRQRPNDRFQSQIYFSVFKVISHPPITKEHL